MLGSNHVVQKNKGKSVNVTDSKNFIGWKTGMPPKNQKNGSGGSGKMTKEEERLLLESSRQVSGTASALFYGNAFIVSVLPLWLYWRVQMMDLITYGIVFIAFTIISTLLLAQAYKKTKVGLKHKISMRREAAISKEINAELNASSGKKLSKAEKDERISWKKNEVADSEATTFSIFYNNTLYLLLVLGFFYFLRQFSPIINYVVASAAAGGLCALLSTGV